MPVLMVALLRAGRRDPIRGNRSELLLDAAVRRASAFLWQSAAPRYDTIPRDCSRCSRVGWRLLFKLFQLGKMLAKMGNQMPRRHIPNGDLTISKVCHGGLKILRVQ